MLGAELKQYGQRVLLVYGGGSTIDCTKAIAAATYYDGDAWDLVKGTASVVNALLIVTVLTLAATGSEMACGGGTLQGFKPLTPKDVEAIFKMCL